MTKFILILLLVGAAFFAFRFHYGNKNVSEIFFSGIKDQTAQEAVAEKAP